MRSLDHDPVRFCVGTEARAVHGFWRHAVTGDPRFAKPGAGVLALREDSPAIDRGVRLPGFNDSFLGKGPDIGAFEFGRPLQRYGPRSRREGASTALSTR